MKQQSKTTNQTKIYSIMKDVIQSELLLIEDRFMELDNMLMISDRDETYILEYEYLRGKRDILLHLLSIHK